MNLVFRSKKAKSASYSFHHCGLASLYMPSVKTIPF